MEIANVLCKKKRKDKSIFLKISKRISVLAIFLSQEKRVETTPDNYSRRREFDFNLLPRIESQRYIRVAFGSIPIRIAVISVASLRHRVAP